MNLKMNCRLIAALALIFSTGHCVTAASPQSILMGRQLFNQDWQPTNPAMGGDGLGPMFNAKSCVACHRQGGPGGAGDATVNAKSIGIESIEIYGGRVSSVSLAELVSRFHPGFVAGEGNITNVAPLEHHGGSEMLRQFHDAMTARAKAQFSEDGGPTDSAEVRIANSSPIVFEQQVDGYRVRIQARMYQRNTTSLFGAGLIDRINDSQLDQHVRTQQSHPEISGRPSTLRDGRYGKFGWRANIATLGEFTDQACANEMGLQTKRKAQAKDPFAQTYVSTMTDINDHQINALRDFVAVLPAPKRNPPRNAQEALAIANGEQSFHQIGCAVCHVPDMKPAAGIYSDLLLHDMGSDSMDLNHAEPYIYRRKLVRNEVDSSIPPNVMVGPSRTYYGPATLVDLPNDFSDEVRVSATNLSSQGGRGVPRQRYAVRPAYLFRAPASPRTLVAFRLLDSKVNPNTRTNSVAITRSQAQRSATDVVARTDLYERMEIQPTNFNQEWRTAPLWGLRDSSPYLHDGRATTILEAIAMHDGESAGTRDRFLNLPFSQRQEILAFLNTLGGE